MKIITGTSCTTCLIVILLLSSVLQLNSQIITRVLSSDDSIQNYIHWYSPIDKVREITTPNVDYKATLLNDKRTSRLFPRIGIQQDISIAMNDGSVIMLGNHAIWNIKLKSPEAKSLSLRFVDTKLAENAIMYLYNENSRFVVGPINFSDFRDGVFRSDYINGNHVNITVFMPNYIAEFNDINISSFDFGVIALEFHDSDFNTSGSCNVNTSCPEGTGWKCEINSVCKIIHSSIGSCSGALINNDCCDLTPYILTANHCVEGFPVEDYIFRFKYESPSCTPNAETNPFEWIVYYGADIKSNWVDSDFGLLELFNSTQGDMTFAGWNRTTTPNNDIVTCIHHPAGDVKKISIDNESPIMDTYEWFVDDWDVGTTEGGSSGSPLFDIDKHIIGQDHRGDFHDPCDLDKGSYYGRLDLSWDGGGTNTTRLSNWLGSLSNPTTLDCQEKPSVQGPNILCDNGNYDLIYNMPCSKTITWNVTPSYLFDSPTSGNGTLASLSAASSSSGNLATLIFTLTSNGCNPIQVQKKIWVGEPAIPDIQMTIDPCLNIIQLFDANFNTVANATYKVILTINCDNIVTIYNVSDIPKTLHLPFRRGCEICIESVLVSNICGSIFDDTLICEEVLYCGEESNIRIIQNDQLDENNSLFQAYPNPTNSIIEINLLTQDNRTITLYDFTGHKIFETNQNESQVKIDLSSFDTGMYLLNIHSNQGSQFQKIIKL